MIVEIIRSRPSYWYHGKEGTRFEVKRDPDGKHYVVSGDPVTDNDPILVIGLEDARILSDDSDGSCQAELTLIAPGSRGKIGEIDILITQVHIESNQVEYTVSWWDDGQRYSERVPAYEITSAEKTMHVGFK